MQLQGRYFASRKINVEFCSITWKSAVCGKLSTKKTQYPFISKLNRLIVFTGKSLRDICFKGHNCNFIHVFRNPNNMFPMRDALTREKRNKCSNKKLNNLER